MTCSVAIASSPAFSPSRIPHSCKTPPETLALSPRLLTSSEELPPSPSPSSSSLRQWVRRGPSGLRTTCLLDIEASPSTAPPVRSSGGGGAVLKRKRPLRIDIPTGEAFSEPERSHGPREVEEESARFSVYCRRGKKRLQMEDRHRAALDLRGDPKMAFFGIFDGHGGKRAAEFASENMGEFIVEEIDNRRGEGCNEIEEAIKIGYMKTDMEFLKEEIHGGGACCVSALLRNGHLVVSNAGDCRAVLSRAGHAEALSSDHRLSRVDERDRVQHLGGYVDFCHGTWRLEGSLAVSRGIGDGNLKRWVIPVPETTTMEIKPECEFLILASDGLWDNVSNQEAVDVARPLCMNGSSLLTACKKLANLSATRGSLDDISVMIVLLQHFV